MLSRLFPFGWHVAGALALALLAFWGWHQVIDSRAEARHQAEIAGWLEKQTKAEAASREAVTAARNEERRRYASLEKAMQYEREQTRVARADAAAAGDRERRLRNQVATLVAAERRRAASDPGAPPSSATDRLAEVFGQCVGRLREVAEAADRAVIAGRACEASYNALRP